MAKVKLRHLHQLRGDLEERVKRRHRILKDHSDPPPSDLSYLVYRLPEHVDAVENDAAARDLARGFGNEPHHR